MNVNDRSMLGFRDSEIAVVYEDDEYIDSYMNNSVYSVGKYVYICALNIYICMHVYNCM